MSTEVAAASPECRAQGSSASDWFGQPRGLTILFLTEMWEMFSYYGMRALLVYYMVKQLAITQQNASLIYGIYTAFVYFTPIVGGVICDRWLGRAQLGAARRLDHGDRPLHDGVRAAVLRRARDDRPRQRPVPAEPAEPDQRAVSARRSASQHGIQLLLPRRECRRLPRAARLRHRRRVVRLALGIHPRRHRHGERPVIYIFGSRYLPPEPLRARPAPPGRLGNTWYEAGMARRFALLAGICGVVVVFRTAYEQIGNTLPLWIEHVDRSVGAFVIPMTWFQSLNPLLVFLLTPWFVARWVRHAREGHELSSIRKMAIGAGGVASRICCWRQSLRGAAAAVASEGWIWLVAFFVVMTAASCTSCRSASACSVGWRPPGSPRRPSRCGSSPLLRQSARPARSAPCGAACRRRSSSQSTAAIAALSGVAAAVHSAARAPSSPKTNRRGPVSIMTCRSLASRCSRAGAASPRSRSTSAGRRPRRSRPKMPRHSSTACCPPPWRSATSPARRSRSSRTMRAAHARPTASPTSRSACRFPPSRRCSARLDLEAVHLDRGDAAGRSRQARSRSRHQRIPRFQDRRLRRPADQAASPDDAHRRLRRIAARPAGRRRQAG